MQAAQNIPGIEVVDVHSLNAELLAPGARIGRLTLYTEAAIAALAHEGLFNENYHNPAIEEKGVKNVDQKKDIGNNKPPIQKKIVQQTRNKEAQQKDAAKHKSQSKKAIQKTQEGEAS